MDLISQIDRYTYSLEGRKRRLGLGDYERAMRDFDLAIAADPNENAEYLLHGRALQRLGRDEEAQKDLNEARRLNPSRSEPPRNP